MPTLEDTIVLAASLHKGQVDKAGQPYILHPLRVMLRARCSDGRLVGVLHDVVEDCNITLRELAGYGYSDAVLDAIDTLTRRPGEQDYDSYIDRVLRGTQLARSTKLHDLADNTDPSRMVLRTAKDRSRQERYRRAQARLLSAQ